MKLKQIADRPLHPNSFKHSSNRDFSLSRRKEKFSIPKRRSVRNSESMTWWTCIGDLEVIGQNISENRKIQSSSPLTLFCISITYLLINSFKTSKNQNSILCSDH